MRGEQLVGNPGAQSHTFLARKSTEPTDEFRYVLKVLKRQDSPDRRAMFHAETSAMSALDHSGVLPIEETNSASYKEAVELFLITRRVMGDDLDQLVSSGLELSDALRIVLRVLDILIHCHSRGVLHRDVKPCHVIAPNGDVDSSVLIDFGLAHSSDAQPADAATGDGPKKGNRFLIGPEHLPGVTIANQSSATDICQCVGLLFFALTKRYPGILQDENGLKPHRRAGVSFAPDIVQWKRESLELIFDKAFEWHPDRRWTNADSLCERLRQLMHQELGPDEMLKLKVLRSIQESNVEERSAIRAKAQEMSNQLFEIAKNVLNVIQADVRTFVQVTWNSQTFGGGFGLGGGGASAENEALSQAIISYSSTQKRGGLDITIQSELEGSQFVAALKPYTGASKIFPDNQPTELGRCDVGDSEALSHIRPRLEECLLVCVQEMLSK